MPAGFKSLMLRATQLTRCGLLGKATAAIQAALRGDSAATGAQEQAGPKGRVFDMERTAIGAPVLEPGTSRPFPRLRRKNRGPAGAFLTAAFPRTP